MAPVFAVFISGKLEFISVLGAGTKKYTSFRASAHTGVGIPWLEGKCNEKHPEKLGDCHTT